MDSRIEMDNIDDLKNEKAAVAMLLAQGAYLKTHPQKWMPFKNLVGSAIEKQVPSRRQPEDGRCGSVAPP